MRIDWLNTPLEEFRGRLEQQEDGTYDEVPYPYGDGFAPSIMTSLIAEVSQAYESLIPADYDKYGFLLEGYPDALRWERSGEVPVIRDGHRRYERFDSLSLSDLPALLDTLVTLEERGTRQQSAIDRGSMSRMLWVRVS